MATSYCLGGPGRNATTAIGTKVRPGTAASNWRELPIGTEFTYRGQRYVIEDRKPTTEGKNIDLWQANCHAAMEWGTPYIEITIITEK